MYPLLQGRSLQPVSSAIRGVVSARVPDGDLQGGISLRHTPVNAQYVDVAVLGVLTPYLMQSKVSEELDVKIRSVAMGGLTINVTLATGGDSGRVVLQPVAMNMPLVSGMMAGHGGADAGFRVARELKKCTVRFKKAGGGAVAGPSLTVGQNGGFQWIGNPSHFSSTMLRTLAYMSNGMLSSEFTGGGLRRIPFRAA